MADGDSYPSRGLAASQQQLTAHESLLPSRIDRGTIDVNAVVQIQRDEPGQQAVERGVAEGNVDRIAAIRSGARISRAAVPACSISWVLRRNSAR